MNVVKKVVGGSESKLPGAAIVSIYSQKNNYGLTESDKIKNMNKDYLCSAFVLNEKWVMTTRECIKYQERNYTVGVGYDKVKMIENGKIKVINIIHKDDISLLELENPIDLNQFKPVCFDKKYEQLAIKNFIGAGFGKVTAQKKKRFSEAVNVIPGQQNQGRYLKQVNLIPNFEYRENNHSYYLKSEIKEVPSKIRESLCFGDEGGPLYYLSKGKTFVVGILIEIDVYKIDDEFAYYCGGKGAARYLKITPHIDWIKEHLGENNYCDMTKPDHTLNQIMSQFLRKMIRRDKK